jgi:hypothetical protein
VAALVAAPGMHHQWSRYAIQFRDDPQDISETLINDSCVAPSGGDCRKIIAERSEANPSAYKDCRANMQQYRLQRAIIISGN